jgi:hypothetical protein
VWRRGRWDINATGPDQDTAILINRHTLSLNEFSFQIVQIRIIELELTLEGAIGQAPPALQQSDRLVEDLLKGHYTPSQGQYGVQKMASELA